MILPKLFELVPKLRFALFAARPELVKRLSNPPSYARIELAIEVARKRRASLRVAHFDERAHHVDPQVRIQVFQQILEGFAVFAFGRELRERDDGGSTAARRHAVPGPREHVGDGALVAERRQSVERTD